MPHVQVGGVQLEYSEQGTGEPILLVHGVLGDLRIWRNQIEPLSVNHRVIAYSRRGHYPNPWPDPPARYSLEVESDDLVGLVKALGLGPVNLVGNSHGASIAAVAARDNPDLVRTVVLNDPGLRALVVSDPDLIQINQGIVQVISSTKKSLAEGNLEDGARIWADSLMGEGSFDRLPSPMRTILVQNARPLIFELSETPQPFTCEDARRIVMPTLLMSGDRTATTFRRICERLAKCIPHSESVTVPGAAHAPYRQNPQFFNDAILKFLARSSSAT